jgi:glycosyltransferase involved in cell wall biosynthesis
LPARKADSLAFVIPCLDEEGSLPDVLDKVNHVRRTFLKGWKTEILVCDNGSTDRSRLVAGRHGARVVHCPQPGYGAALLNGIRASRSRVVVMGDADNTYDFLEAPRLIRQLEKGYHLVVGSRLSGRVEPGAMPGLHRYVGTPLLSMLISALHAGPGKFRVTDCNSGFRCFDRQKCLGWNLKSAGMEFASEMLAKALKNGSPVSEVPITFHAGQPGRRSHLNPVRDGLRHFKVILFPSA